MLRRIAVNFGRGRLKKSRFNSFSETEHIHRAENAGFNGFYRIVLVVDGRGGTCEIKNPINLDAERFCDVMSYQFKPAMPQQGFNVFFSAGEEVIETNDVVAIVNQTGAKRRADETASAGY
jgi:hypothetical protein